MSTTRHLWLAVAILVAPGVGPFAYCDTNADVEFFEKKVRPVLAEHCLRCHGGDSKKIKGGLRVDSREALLRGGDSGPALVAGQPEQSRLIEAVSYKNTDLLMPPKGKLDPALVADLARWVKDGAAWPAEPATVKQPSIKEFNLAARKRAHWAWQPVQRPEVPSVQRKDWPRWPVDAFLLAKMEERGLSPASPADRATLLRRLSFDLIGLPPSPEELRAFLADPSPQAVETVVDRLLASPHFGERWARHWLDLVRYAESRGHEFDSTAPNAWQYRDYVIRALNADVPYHQFVTEHIAGDLMLTPRYHPQAGFNESVLGTGFWLLGEEVHSPVDIRQDLADRLDNRIDVFSKTFLGLTVSCARCHDHKFDAISTADYYALFGILEGASARLVRFDTLEHNRKLADTLARYRSEQGKIITGALAEDPGLKQASEYLLAARSLLQGSAQQDWATPTPGQHAKVNDCAVERKLDATLLAGWLAALHAAAQQPDDPLHAWAEVARGRPLVDVLKSSPPEDNEVATAVFDAAALAPNDWQVDEGAFGSGPVPRGRLLPGEEVRFAEESAAVYDRAWDALTVSAGTEAEPGALGARIRAGRTLRTPAFTLTTGRLCYLLRGAATVYAAVEDHGLIAGPLHSRLVLDAPRDEHWRWVAHELTPYVGRRVHLEFTAQPGHDFALRQAIQAATPPTLPNTTQQILVKADIKTPEQLAVAYRDRFVEAIAHVERPGNARLVNWLLQHPALLAHKKLDSVLANYHAERHKLVATLRPESRLALALFESQGADEHVFVRGSPKALGAAVPRRFLEALAGPSPLASTGSGRLELARQLTDPTLDPLIARVAVNRIWHHLMGRGIVASTDNFGVLGELPSNPQLLDWLATNFVQQGWSTKSLIRSIVLSSAYRMDSRGPDAAEAVDPQNLLWHRMPLRRLEGEAIRDAILANSGRLDRTLFGPSVPIHLTPFLEGRGRPASGPIDGKGRRSVYLGIRRNFLSPFLLAFDTPIPFSTVGRRTVSNVPAQALILLNDPFVHEQSQVWARTILARPTPDRQRIEEMVVRAYGRSATAAEVENCQNFLSQRHAGDDPVGAWADLCHALWNVKEFIYVR